MGVKIDIVVGQRPERAREMVLATEAFIREISDDPSEGVMTLLVTAVHIARQHSPRTPPEQYRGLGEALRLARRAAEELFGECPQGETLQ
jgi:hypothetical protein